MDLKALVVESGKIVLADISPAWAAIEGDVQPDDRVWVKSRQATTGDHRRRAVLHEKRAVQYKADSDGKIASITEEVNDNPYSLRAMEVWLTLLDIGNLTSDGKPIFPKLPVRQMSQSEFEATFDSLPTALSSAIHEACLKMNPSWKPGLGG